MAPGSPGAILKHITTLAGESPTPKVKTRQCVSILLGDRLVRSKALVFEISIMGSNPIPSAKNMPR